MSHHGGKQRIFLKIDGAMAERGEETVESTMLRLIRSPNEQTPMVGSRVTSSPEEGRPRPQNAPNDALRVEAVRSVSQGDQRTHEGLRWMPIR